ncbi:MAG: Flp pilus assembly complex ATPase component TadA, partial [Candidatus Hydrogenedentes bacterium]|nr:Flp pilus assembly complex ATPase component TadA [Candidatus Hydrogenedentota bacterium]
MVKLQIVRHNERDSDDDRNSVPLRDIDALLKSRIENNETGIVDAVEIAVNQAVMHNASDIHFEPWDDCMSVRYRIDGILHEIARIPQEYQDKVTARIKIMAKMVVYKKDIPQDGRIDGDKTMCGRPMRVSTFPTVYGEKTVVRLLRSDTDLRTLDSLGFRPDVVAGLRDIISRPQGTLLLTGPSSSGKTTT